MSNEDRKLDQILQRGAESLLSSLDATLDVEQALRDLHSDPIAAAAETTANTVITEHGLPHEDGEPALETLGRALGGEIDCGQGLRAFAEALLAPYPTISEIRDLVEAKIELLSDYKLDYPQDYSPSDIARMNEEVVRLRALQDRLLKHQA